MPMTDAEWQALDARIARDLMGCVKWEELTEEEREAIKQSKVWRHYDGYWWQRGEGTPRLMCGTLLWQPYKEVAQALAVKDHIVRQLWRGCRFSMDCVQHLGTRAMFQRDGQSCRGTHKTDAAAICLAAEQWLDAQKELQDD